MAYNIKKKIKILDYFDMEILNEDGVTPASSTGKLRGACKICGKSYSGTERVKSNYITHLRKSHPIQYEEFQIGSGRQSVLSLAPLNDSTGAPGRLPPQYSPAVFPSLRMRTDQSSAIPASVFPSTSANNPKVAVLPERRSLPSAVGRNTPFIMSSITRLVLDDLIPLEMLKSPRFKDLLQSIHLGSSVILPAPADVESHILEASIDCQHKLQSEMMDAPYIWVSVETWRQSGSSFSYLTISTHYLNSWIYQHANLGCHKIDEDDAGSQAIVKGYLDQYCISHKTQGIMTNLNAGIQLPMHAESTALTCTEQQLMSESTIAPSIVSFEARLGKAVLRSIIECNESMKETLVKATEIMTLPNMPWKRGESYEKLQWYEQLNLLDIIVKMDPATKEAIRETAGEDLFLGAEQEQILKSLLTILERFKMVAMRISLAKGITSSLVIPSIKIIQTINEDLQKEHPNEPLAQSLRNHTKELVEEKLANNISLQLATMLDPRFKVQWCESEDRESMKDALIKVAQESDAMNKVKVEIKPSPSASASGFFSKILKDVPATSSSCNKMLEVYRYLEEPLQPEDADPLAFWRANEDKLPSLAKLAQKYLAIPMSRGDIRALYEKPHQVFSINNTPLSGEVLENAVMLRANRK